MPLRLLPEHQAEYDKACQDIEDAKQRALAIGDQQAAKICRQQMNVLYQAFKPLELPPEPPSYYEQCYLDEESMTVEQRLDRIEEHLKIGKFAENFGLRPEDVQSPPWD